MVRYTRLPFRLLCLKWGVDVVYTPMFVAEGFCKSQKARDADFTTCKEDSPLIVQFAAKDPMFFSKGAEIVRNHCAGVDLNCGCPQKWANDEGMGAEMLNHPDILSSCIKAVKNLPSSYPPDIINVNNESETNNNNTSHLISSSSSLSSFLSSSSSSIPVSIKIRICERKRETMGSILNTGKIHDLENEEFNGGDMHRTLELVRMIEREGADYITIHGRTRPNACSVPVSLSAIKMVKESVSIPVVANGDIFSREQAAHVKKETGVDGVMAARGLLHNPALFYTCSPTLSRSIPSFPFPFPFPSIQSEISSYPCTPISCSSSQSVLNITNLNNKLNVLKNYSQNDKSCANDKLDENDQYEKDISITLDKLSKSISSLDTNNNHKNENANIVFHKSNSNKIKLNDIPNRTDDLINSYMFSVISDFLTLSTHYFSSPYKIIHNHIMMMIFPLLGRGERTLLSECCSFFELIEFVKKFLF